MASVTQSNIWKSASTAFSRNAVTDVLKYNDFSHLNWVFSICPTQNSILTYLDLMDVVYRNMTKHYRCEYVFKNEIIKHLIRDFKKRDKSVVFNEFRVSDSIADLAIFNGESKAFEIKTEFDSSRRLEKQMSAYRRIFDKSYIVVPENKLSDYLSAIDDTIGIILLTYHKGRVNLFKYREAEQNREIDTNTLIRCLRTSEYEKIVSSYYGKLPDVATADMFDACAEKLSKIPSSVLRELFLLEIKKRKSDLGNLKSVPQSLTQLCVSLNLKYDGISSLVKSLNTRI